MENGSKYTLDDIVGESDLIRHSKKIVKIVSKYDEPVLITGETGTGKELFAHAIHNESNRKKKPFIARNCGVFVSSIMGNELFGHEDGAFTGAKRGGKKGLFEEANGGSIFLDEIGDLPIDLQIQLLRVLQEGEVNRIGGHTSIKINVRIIAATNKNLRKLVKEGRFREDLFHRLNVFSLHIAPLRKRRKDILYLVPHLLEKISDKKGIFSASEEVLKYYQRYRWPGNIRELENLIKIELAFLSENETEINHIPFKLKRSIMKHKKKMKEAKNKSKEENLSNAETENIAQTEKELKTLQELEKEAIIRTLKKFDGNKQKSAKSLGIGRNTLYQKIKKYKLDYQ